MMKKGIGKGLNRLLSFSDGAKPFKFKNNLRIILGPKPERFKNIETSKKFGILTQKCEIFQKTAAIKRRQLWEV